MTISVIVQVSDASSMGRIGVYTVTSDEAGNDKYTLLADRTVYFDKMSLQSSIEHANNIADLIADTMRALHHDVRVTPAHSKLKRRIA